MANSSTVDWNTIVSQAKDKELREPPVAYEWSNGREDRSTDKSDSGCYDGN